LAGKLLVLATGGTIAGLAQDPARPDVYQAAQLAVEALVRSAPALAELHALGRLELEQLAQIDSKDMSFAVWRDLALAARSAMRRDDVDAVLVTHGTDTLEETAYFLRCTVPAIKPVVITGAMRAANAPGADGPANLRDAAAFALRERLPGVWVVMGAEVFAAGDVRKLRSQVQGAFAGLNSGVPLGATGLREQDASRLRDVDAQAIHHAQDLALEALDPASWPWVEIITSAAGADGRVVDALVSAGVRGLVVAGTGSGTIHHVLQAALERAHRAGVRILVASRLGLGEARDPRGSWPRAGGLSPAQARVRLILELLALPPGR
jgi:L-asparaginase